jgi:hypothetical protein
LTLQPSPIAVAPRSLAERKAWALRQGNPLWLWPEVAPRDWRLALLEIERVCVAILAGKRAEAVAADAAVLGLAGYTSGTGPLVGHWLEQGLIAASPAVGAVCRSQLRANQSRMELLLGRAAEVTGRLTAAGVGVTVLKGAHTALTYFPHSGCRPMSDIDVLVAPADEDAAARLLRGLGYRRTAATSLESTWAHRDSAREPRTMVALEANDPWAIDVHLSLDVPGPPGAPTARLSTLERMTAPCPAIPGARQLAQPLLLLHLAAHAGSGFHNLTLLRLVEIVLVARADTASNSLAWDEFAELGAATGGLAFAYPALAMARSLSPDDIPQAVVELCAAEAPAQVRRLVAELRPATAHRIERPTLREHFAWTRGSGGWLRRLASDLLPEPRSLRATAAIHASRARGLWRQRVTQAQP